jgi:hypothetical protein
MSDRFYVVELLGHRFDPASSWNRGAAKPTLTCSVIDRFYCHREVGRFEQPRAVPGGLNSRERMQAWPREQAAALAARLNAEAA